MGVNDSISFKYSMGVNNFNSINDSISFKYKMSMIALVLKYSMGVNDSINFKYSMDANDSISI